MSKITKDSILSTFPLASDKDQLALAQAVADHLVDLYRDTDLLSIYANELYQPNCFPYMPESYHDQSCPFL